MIAITISEKGSLENIKIEELEKPSIAADQVLVQVKACGVNPVDWKAIKNGIFDMPYTVGSDISGIVTEVGVNVASLKTGDEVIGSLEWSTQGAFAEYVATEEKYLTLKPKNLNFNEAAAVPLTSLTAWQGLFDHLKLEKGQKILIQAAAGGVGLFALQFAKWKAAHVVALASPKNKEFLESFGADEVFDYHQDFSLLPKDFDAVFDSMASSEKTIPLLKENGRYVSITAKPSQELAEKHKVTAGNFLFHSDKDQLSQIAKLIEEGAIKVVLDKEYPLKEAIKALEYQQEGHSRGKNVLVIG